MTAPAFTGPAVLPSPGASVLRDILDVFRRYTAASAIPRHVQIDIANDIIAAVGWPTHREAE